MCEKKERERETNSNRKREKTQIEREREKKNGEANTNRERERQLDSTWNPHLKIEFLKICVRTTLAQIGQIISSLEKQELKMLKTTLANLHDWEE